MHLQVERVYKTVQRKTHSMSRKLRTLLKQNRRLEEKIFYEPRKTDWRKDLISPQELSEALSYLSDKIISNQTTDISILKMFNQVDFLTGRPLASFEKNAIQVVEILFNYLRFNAGYKQRYFPILNNLQIIFTRLALSDLSFIDNPKHPAILFMEKLINVGYLFDETSGKLTRYLMHAIELLLEKLVAKEDISAKSFTIVHPKLLEYLSGFEEKVEVNNNKLLAKIDKKSRNAQADYYTDQLIKTKTDGEEIPIFLLDFFENQLSKVLHNLIMEYGIQSKQCQQLLTDMDTISWSISCPLADPTFHTRFEADVTPTLKRLYEHFQNMALANEYVDSFFYEIETLHKDKLDGKRIDLDVMISADIFTDNTYETDPIDSWNSKPSQDFEISQLKEGSCYYLKTEQQQIKCRLLMINELTEELYFVNLSGELVQTIQFNDKDFLTENLEMFILDDVIHFSHAIKSLELELQSKLDVLEIEFQQFQQQAIADEQKKEILEEKARKAVLKRLEEEKRQIDLRRSELLAKKKQQQDAIIEKEKREAARRFKAKGMLRKLGPGSEVAIMLTKDRWTEASLMIISKTTDRYIFSNSHGKKIFEPNKEELIEFINNGQIKVIQSKISNHDPLQSLVAERRQKLSERN